MIPEEVSPTQTTKNCWEYREDNADEKVQKDSLVNDFHDSMAE